MFNCVRILLTLLNRSPGLNLMDIVWMVIGPLLVLFAFGIWMIWWGRHIYQTTRKFMTAPEDPIETEVR